MSRRLRIAALLALGGSALANAGCGQAGSPSYEAQIRASQVKVASATTRPIPASTASTTTQPQAQAPVLVAHRHRKRPVDLGPKPGSKPRPQSQSQPEIELQPSTPPPPPTSPGEMPPASVGNNGSYSPPPESERKKITPSTIPKLEREAAEGRAIPLNAIAQAPPSAPKAIRDAISAANELVGLPYIWGGGHASWYANGYDCSGAVSYALGGGGFLSAPLASTALESWGAPGPGRWLTVYANSEHAFMVIAGLRFDTVGDAHGSGPRWHPALADTEGFVARHPPGY